jgi:hypothetical protein
MAMQLLGIGEATLDRLFAPGIDPFETFLLFLYK